MRTLFEIDRDIDSLRRPRFPGMVGAMAPAIYDQWRRERDAWAAATPNVAQRYDELLAERDVVEAELKRQHLATGMLERARTPKRVREALTLNRRCPAFDIVDEWIREETPWLVFSGATGVGKSVAAGYGLRRLLQAGKRGEWVLSAALTKMVGKFDAEAELERVKHVDVLVVDDFGTEHQSEFAQSVFFEVLAHRHEERLRTVITTNLDGPELSARMGARLYDRVRSACVFAPVEGNSLRGAA